MTVIFLISSKKQKGNMYESQEQSPYCAPIPPEILEALN